MSKIDIEYTFLKQISGMSPRNWVRAKREERDARDAVTEIAAADLRDLRLRAEELSEKRDNALLRQGYMLALERLGLSVSLCGMLTESDKDTVAGVLHSVRADAPGEPE